MSSLSRREDATPTATAARVSVAVRKRSRAAELRPSLGSFVVVVVRVKGASRSHSGERVLRIILSLIASCTCTSMSVAPRSQNPHLLPQDVKIVSRAEVFAKDDNENDLAKVDGEIVRLLNDLLAQSLEYERPTKRRRVEDESYEYIVQEPRCAFGASLAVCIPAKAVNKCLG